MSVKTVIRLQYKQ